MNWTMRLVSALVFTAAAFSAAPASADLIYGNDFEAPDALDSLWQIGNEMKIVEIGGNKVLQADLRAIPDPDPSGEYSTVIPRIDIRTDVYSSVTIEVDMMIAVDSSTIGVAGILIAGRTSTQVFASDDGTVFFSLYQVSVLPGSWYRLSLTYDIDQELASASVNGQVIGTTVLPLLHDFDLYTELFASNFLGDNIVANFDNLAIFGTPRDLNGTVPEPSSVVLLFGGLGVAALVRNRKDHPIGRVGVRC